MIIHENQKDFSRHKFHWKYSYYKLFTYQPLTPNWSILNHYLRIILLSYFLFPTTLMSSMRGEAEEQTKIKDFVNVKFRKYRRWQSWPPSVHNVAITFPLFSLKISLCQFYLYTIQSSSSYLILFVFQHDTEICYLPLPLPLPSAFTAQLSETLEPTDTFSPCTYCYSHSPLF